MESPSPSQAPVREVRMPSVSSYPPLRRSSKSPLQRKDPTLEMPAAREPRRPPIPQKEIDRDLRFIAKFVSETKPGLSAKEAEMLDNAAEAAEGVSSISPVTEFMARLDVDFILRAQEAYQRFKADPKA